MRKTKRILLFIIVVFLCYSAESQILRYNNYVASTTTSSSYSEEYQDVYDAYGTPPSEEIADLQNTMVSDLVDGGYWARMDYLLVFANNNSTNALINWITPGTNNASNVSSTAFTENVGFTGDGAADYIETNLNLSSETSNYTQNSASAGIAINGNIAENVCLLGAYTSTARLFLMPRDADNDYCETQINNTSAGGVYFANANSSGIHIISRTSSTTIEVYRNGGSIQTRTDDTSTALPDETVTILTLGGVYSSFSTHTVRIFFLMNGLNDTDADAVNDILQEYLTAIDAL